MVSGNKSKAARGARAVVVNQRSTPWGLIAGVAVVVVFAAAVFGFYYQRKSSRDSIDAALAPFTPTVQNPDPASTIPGIVIAHYEGRQHVRPEDQVAYTASPPFGGAHDASWATCTGVVYDQPVRNENMVHSLEHGTVWIAYNADQLDAAGQAALRAKVENQAYMMMSPYPGLDTPISLQSWGHQLKLSDPDDPRIDEFIRGLRRNPYGPQANPNGAPEPNGTCSEISGGGFAQYAPPPFAPPPAPGTPGSFDANTGQRNG